MTSSTTQWWKSGIQSIFANLMQTCGFRSTDIASLESRIESLGEKAAQLEEKEEIAWQRVQSSWSCDLTSAFTALKFKRKQKDWRSVNNQLQWIEEEEEGPLLAQPIKDSCASLWNELEENHRERAALMNVRSFHADFLKSWMNLDNCYDMKGWELVEGGNTGYNVSKSRCVGVFKASGRDGKVYAVKCVKGDNTVEIKNMKREVELHSILLHPCVLQYSGDYTISSSHFLKFIMQERFQTALNLQHFSDMYSVSRRYLFIVSEFCSGGSMIQYVNGYPRPYYDMDEDDATFMAAYVQPSSTDHFEEFRSLRSHHLYAGDHIVLFPPGCDNARQLAYLAVVVKVSDSPGNCSDPELFRVRRVPACEVSVQRYFSNYALSEHYFNSDCFFFHHVCLKESSEGLTIYKTLPRPGFSFIRNFCYKAISALRACSLQHVYHGDVRLENFFLRKVVEMDDVLGGDDVNCSSVSVQLGDFDLATADKDRTEEFSRDRHQLVVALLVLVGGSKYSGIREIHRMHLKNTLGFGKNLQRILSEEDFCQHLPSNFRDHFKNLLIGLWDSEDCSEYPTLKDLLNLSEGIFSSVPDVNDMIQSVTDLSISDHFYLGPNDVSDASEPDKKTSLTAVEAEASEIISSISSTIQTLCLRFDAASLDSACVGSARLLKNGFSASTMKSFGFTSEQLKKLGFDEANDGRSSSAFSSAVSACMCSPHSAELDPEEFAWRICAEQMQRVTKTMQRLCEKCGDCPSPDHLETSKSFFQEDKKPVLLHPDTCKVFLRNNLCDCLGSAVKELFEAREHLTKRRLEIEGQYPKAQAIASCCKKKLEQLSGLARSIGKIESYIVLIMEQSAVHREIQSLMFLSSNDALISFLSTQFENPNQNLSGNNAPLSLFVQLFAFSDPGYLDLAKLGSVKPIFDSQTKLESLITHSLFEKIQQACSGGSCSVLLRIFQFAFDKIDSFVKQGSSQQGEITSSEQNLTYALCALVNISLSFKWCIESNITPNPYSLARPCVNCEFNEQTSILFCKLLPLRNAIHRLQSRGKFCARMAHLISDWWHRMERPSFCACTNDKVVGDEQLKTVKKIVSPNFLNLHSTTRRFPGLHAALSGFPASSPENSPKLVPKVPTRPPPPPLDVAPLEFSPSYQTPRSKNAVADVSQSDDSPPVAIEFYSRTRVSTPRSPPESSEKVDEAPQILTPHETILKLLHDLQHGRHVVHDSSDCEIDLTVLHGESDHLERIMQAAAKDLPQCCRRNSFDFITCKSVRKRDHRREDNTAVACIGFLSTCSLKSVKHLPCPKGTFCLFNDRDRQYRLLRICPFRKTESAALCTPKDAHHWVAVDSWGHFVLGDLLDLGREPVSLSKLHEGAQRAARKFSKQSQFKSQSIVTVQLHPNFEDFQETFKLEDLTKGGRSRRNSGRKFSRSRSAASLMTSAAEDGYETV